MFRIEKFLLKKEILIINFESFFKYFFDLKRERESWRENYFERSANRLIEQGDESREYTVCAWTFRFEK